MIVRVQPNQFVNMPNLFTMRWIVAVYIFVFCSCAWPIQASKTYSAEKISARVLDANSGRPLQGVHIVATWEVMGGLETKVVGYQKVMEAITDGTGAFTFPAWGPTPKKMLGLITNGAPVLRFFKSGYRFLTLRNPGLIERAPSPMRSYWNGQTIKLEQFIGSLDDYSLELSLSLGDAIDTILGKEDCVWKEMPKFLWAVDQQSQLFAINKTRWTLGGLDYWDTRSRNSRCGSLKGYVEERGK